MTEGQNNCSAKGKCKFFIGVPTVKGKKFLFAKLDILKINQRLKEISMSM